jgi:hypothetical protein
MKEENSKGAKSLVFLYPINDYINHQIHDEWICANAKSPEAFRDTYEFVLNECINERYRKKNFSVNYVVFDGELVYSGIELGHSDNVINAGVDFHTHVTQKKYADNNLILEKLKDKNGKIQHLRVAGFHMWDCVSKFARTAHEKGMNVLVDEDLTEFFPARMRDKNFRVGRYPAFKPRERGEEFFRDFMKARENAPWLWQKY